MRTTLLTDVHENGRPKGTIGEQIVQVRTEYLMDGVLYLFHEKPRARGEARLAQDCHRPAALLHDRCVPRVDANAPCTYGGAKAKQSQHERRKASSVSGVDQDSPSFKNRPRTFEHVLTAVSCLVRQRNEEEGAPCRRREGEETRSIVILPRTHAPVQDLAAGADHEHV